MTDRNRNQDLSSGGRQQSSGGSVRPDEELTDIAGLGSPRAERDRASVADDRGMDRERRSFNGDREHDELGSEMEDVGFDESDDELGGTGQSER